MAKATAQSISGPTVGQPRKVALSERLGTHLYRSIRHLRGQDRQHDQEQDQEGDKPQAASKSTPANTTSSSSSATSSPSPQPPITLVCISDTHNTKPENLPLGDILIHAGDLSQYGTFAEIQAQLSWLAAQPHPHKLVIAGNHDLLLDKAFVAAHPDRELDCHPGKTRADLDWGDIHYLENASLELDVEVEESEMAGTGTRTIRVFGSPWTPRCGSWAFQYSADGEECFQWSGAIPGGTDVLVVHGPPLGHVDDGGNGCPQLLAEIWRCRPLVLVCGHIHAGRGGERLFFDQAQADYEAAMAGKRPWMAVLRLAVTLCWLQLFGTGTRHGDNPCAGATEVVNAAVVAGRGNRESLPATVVRL